MLVITEEIHLEKFDDEDDEPEEPDNGDDSEAEEPADRYDEGEEPCDKDDEGEESYDKDDDEEEPGSRDYEVVELEDDGDAESAEETDNWELRSGIPEPQEIQEVYSWVQEDFFEDNAETGEEPDDRKTNEIPEPSAPEIPRLYNLVKEKHPEKKSEAKPGVIAISNEEAKFPESISQTFGPLFFTPDRGKERDLGPRGPYGTSPAVIGGRGAGEPGSRAVFLRAR